MKVLVLFGLLFVSFTIAKADAFRSRTIFESENNEYELVLKNKREILRGKTIKENWSLIHKTSKKELYKINTEYLWSKIALVSNDGKSIVVIDDYSIREYKDNPEVLTFYHQGKRTKSYKLTDLYDKYILTCVTVSHFRWSNFYEDEGKIEKSKFKLTSFELNHFTFNIKTGNIIEKKRDKSLTEDSVFVLGYVTQLRKNLYEITVDCDIFGNISKGDKVRFQFTSKVDEPNSYTLYPRVIENEKTIWTNKISHVNVCKSKASFLK